MNSRDPNIAYREGHIDALLAVSNQNNRHYRVFVLSANRNVDEQTALSMYYGNGVSASGDGNDNGGGGGGGGGGDDDGDEAEEVTTEEAEEEEAGGGKGKKRGRSKRKTAQRMLIGAADRVPLLHVGAFLQIVVRRVPQRQQMGQRPQQQDLRASNGSSSTAIGGTAAAAAAAAAAMSGEHSLFVPFEIVQCLSYVPPDALSAAMLKLPLCAPLSLVTARTQRIEQRETIVEENLISPSMANMARLSASSGGAIGNSGGGGVRTVEAPVPAKSRGALPLLKVDNAFTLESLLADIAIPYPLECLKLSRSLEGFFIATGAAVLMARDYQFVPALKKLATRPDVSAAAIERLSVHQVIDCAIMTTSNPLLDLLAATRIAQPDFMIRKLCVEQRLLRAITALPYPPRFERFAPDLPVGAGRRFFERMCRLVQPPPFGATLVDSGMQRPSREDEDYIAPKAAPAKAAKSSGGGGDDDDEPAAAADAPDAENGGGDDGDYGDMPTLGAAISHAAGLPRTIPSSSFNGGGGSGDGGSLAAIAAAAPAQRVLEISEPNVLAWLRHQQTLHYVGTPRNIRRRIQKKHSTSGNTAPLVETQYVCTSRAYGIAQELASLLWQLKTLLTLVGTNTSCVGARGLGDEAFFSDVVGERGIVTQYVDDTSGRVIEAHTRPLVLLVFASTAHQCLYEQQFRTKSREPALYGLMATTIAALVAAECASPQSRTANDAVRVFVCCAQRIVIVDAHTICEHDMLPLLASIYNMRHMGDDDDGGDASIVPSTPGVVITTRTTVVAPFELVLVGDIDTIYPSPHCESGAPFSDAWQCGRFTTQTLWPERPPPRYAVAVACRDSPSARCKFIARLIPSIAACIRTQADVCTALFKVGGFCWQVLGSGREAFKRACTRLVDTLDPPQRPGAARPESSMLNGVHEGDIAEMVRLLRGLVQSPSRARSVIIRPLGPFVQYGDAIVRIDNFYLSQIEGDRLMRATTSDTNRMQRIGTNVPCVSLDSPGLYLEVAATDLSTVDHRNCCLTTDSRLLCVANHRHLLRAASIVMARDVAASVRSSVATVALLFAPPSVTSIMMGGSGARGGGGAARAQNSDCFGDCGIDAPQLLMSTIAARTVPRITIVMPGATPEQCRRTIDAQAANLDRYFGKPLTVLEELLRAATAESAIPHDLDDNGAADDDDASAGGGADEDPATARVDDEDSRWAYHHAGDESNEDRDTLSLSSAGGAQANEWFDE